jgi:hypothetical protein
MSTPRFLRNQQAGSVIVLVLMTFVVMSMLVGSVVMRTLNNYHSVVQVGTWQEALLGAESASDLALAALRKSILTPDTAWTGWTTTDAAGNPLPDGGKSFTAPTLVHSGDGSVELDAKVTVDAPPQLLDANGRQWYRIRATGTTSLPGNSRIGADKRDHLLRRLSFVFDRKTGTAVVRPQASRMVEVIARPASFDDGIVADGLIEMNNYQIVVDSYDSRDPAKSTNGNYDQSKRRENGDVATNGQIIEAGGAQIYGDVLTNSGVVTGAANVTGEQRTDFYKELLPISRPTWTTIIANPTAVRNTATLTGGSKANPARYKLSEITLAGSGELTFAASAPGVESYVEVWVTGDVKGSGNGQITLQPGVHVKVYVEGNVAISGNGVVNENTKPVFFQMFGVKPTDGSARQFTVTGNGEFVGVLYAPSHRVTLSGGGSSGTYWGAIVAKEVSMNGHTSVHYDEALSDGGFISDYRIVSWFEDNR